MDHPVYENQERFHESLAFKSPFAAQSLILERPLCGAGEYLDRVFDDELPAVVLVHEGGERGVVPLHVYHVLSGGQFVEVGK